MFRKLGWIAALVVAASCADNESGDEWQLNESTHTTTAMNNTSSNNMSSSNNATTVTNNTTTSSNNTTANSNNVTTSTNSNTTLSCLPPATGRSESTVCDDQRSPGANVPDDAANVSCQSDDECVDGDNGRCVGNSHDGYYCTYDECFADDDCAGGICLCGGGFRSDHNICVPSNCQTDADCGEAGWCAPSDGECGDYFGTVGYFCRTCEDECVTDSDCGEPAPGGAFCMYDPGLGRRRCSNSHCVG